MTLRRRPLLPHRRTLMKLLHWGMVPLFIWFLLVQPADVARIGPAAVRFHSVMGLVFVSAALLWWVSYMRRGLLGRPRAADRGDLDRAALGRWDRPDCRAP